MPHSWHIIVVLIITLIISDRWRMGIRAWGHKILIAQLKFVVAGSITIIFWKPMRTIHKVINSLDRCILQQHKIGCYFNCERRALRGCVEDTAAMRQGGPCKPESDATLAPASLSLSEAMAKGRASKLALISSERSTQRSAAFLWAWPSAYANDRHPKLARTFVF